MNVIDMHSDVKDHVPTSLEIMLPSGVSFEEQWVKEEGQDMIEKP